MAGGFFVFLEDSLSDLFLSLITQFFIEADADLPFCGSLPHLFTDILNELFVQNSFFCHGDIDVPDERIFFKSLFFQRVDASGYASEFLLECVRVVFLIDEDPLFVEAIGPPLGCLSLIRKPVFPATSPDRIGKIDEDVFPL